MLYHQRYHCDIRELFQQVGEESASVSSQSLMGPYVRPLNFLQFFFDFLIVITGEWKMFFVCLQKVLNVHVKMTEEKCRKKNKCKAKGMSRNIMYFSSKDSKGSQLSFNVWSLTPTGIVMLTGTYYSRASNLL